MSNKRFFYIALLLLAFAAIYSCSNKSNLDKQHSIDIYRLDKALFELNSSEPLNALKTLHAENTLFFEAYFLSL